MVSVPEKDNERFFLRSRATLYSLCIFVFLFRGNLLVFLDKIFQGTFTENQNYTLLGIVFILLLVFSIRYHQAVLLSKSWHSMTENFAPYKHIELWKRGILLERLERGISEYTDEDWEQMEHSGDLDWKNYIFQEESYYGGTSLRVLGKYRDIKNLERVKVWLTIARAKFVALMKFIFNHTSVFDVVVPYLFALITFLELTGILRVSAFIVKLGSFLTLQ